MSILEVKSATKSEYMSSGRKDLDNMLEEVVNKKLIMLKYYIKDRMLSKSIRDKGGMEQYFGSRNSYIGKILADAKQISKVIYDLIQSGNPACVGRFGATELFCASMFEFGVKVKQEKAISQLVQWSGFFPEDVNYGEAFNEIIIESCSQVDVLGVWGLRFEEYYAKRYCKNNLYLSFLYNIEPWSYQQLPWTEALKGKRVLVIHPFEDTIKKQYEKREKLFPDTNILPEFDLLTLKAVQTVAGTKDERFSTWFEALEYMYSAAMEINFDVAILGCGAYGLPLAAKLKQAGKVAIHLGGGNSTSFRD